MNNFPFIKFNNHEPVTTDVKPPTEVQYHVFAVVDGKPFGRVNANPLSKIRAERIARHLFCSGKAKRAYAIPFRVAKYATSVGDTENEGK